MEKEREFANCKDLKNQPQTQQTDRAAFSFHTHIWASFVNTTPGFSKRKMLTSTSSNAKVAYIQ